MIAWPRVEKLQDTLHVDLVVHRSYTMQFSKFSPQVCTTSQPRASRARSSMLLRVVQAHQKILVALFMASKDVPPLQSTVSCKSKGGSHHLTVLWDTACLHSVQAESTTSSYWAQHCREHCFLIRRLAPGHGGNLDEFSHIVIPAPHLRQ